MERPLFAGALRPRAACRRRLSRVRCACGSGRSPLRRSAAAAVRRDLGSSDRRLFRKAEIWQTRLVRRLAILTSGGDAPGMNAAIRSATLLALSKGVEVFGVHQGYQGLMQGDLIPLDPATVGGIIREGGTILGSARSMEFM